MHPPDLKEPIDFESLLPAAVRAGIKGADFQAFQSWMDEALPTVLAATLRQSPLPADGLRLLSLSLARAVWNALPLPRNGFRPEIIPAPGRNDRCPCGSGLKYKHCCLRDEHGPQLNLREEALWPWVLEQLTREQLAEAMRLKRVPLETLAQHALTLSESGKPKEAIRLLQSCFDPAARFDRAADHAFDVLCTLYDQVGQTARKTELIERVLTDAPRSPLRGAAWARLAAIRADNHDKGGAWDAFRHAQRDDTDNPMLCVLEVQLLLAEGRTDEARRRARFWSARLERRGGDEAEQLIELLREIADDPDRAFAQVSLGGLDAENQGLFNWIKGIRERPLPDYLIVRDDDARATGTIEDTLRNLGVPQQDIARRTAEINRQVSRIEKKEPPEIMEPAPLLHQLVAPQSIRALERDWSSVFPLSKPFSIQDDPFDQVDVWAPGVVATWCAHLTAHAECADSISILDDLATALGQHEAFGQSWFDRECARPLLERAVAILECAVSQSSDPRLAWSITANRPALRSLARLYGLEIRADRGPQALRHAQRLLDLNPEDNHGMRTIVVDALLKAGENDAALELAARFAGDLHTDIAYGRALALFRLRRLEEATVALRAAITDLPKVPRYLLAEKIRRPKLHETGVTIGGDDQAWYYREDMRDVWRQTPEALAWLEAVQRQLRPRRSRK